MLTWRATLKHTNKSLAIQLAQHIKFGESSDIGCQVWGLKLLQRGTLCRHPIWVKLVLDGFTQTNKVRWPALLVFDKVHRAKFKDQISNSRTASVFYSFERITDYERALPHHQWTPCTRRHEHTKGSSQDPQDPAKTSDDDTSVAIGGARTVHAVTYMCHAIASTMVINILPSAPFASP